MPLTPLCTDADLLIWEPNIFRDAPFASQTLLTGTGTLSGTTFSIAAGSFEDAGIDENHVIVLGGDADGCFPIRSIDAADQITVSVFDDPTQARPPAASGSLAFTIRTFRPQRAMISEMIAHAAGVDPSDDSSPIIVNRARLVRLCALGTCQLIYSALSAVSDDNVASMRAEVYERLYRRALRSAIVELDTDGDGIADVSRMLSFTQFQRV